MTATADYSDYYYNNNIIIIICVLYCTMAVCDAVEKSGSSRKRRASRNSCRDLGANVLRYL